MADWCYSERLKGNIGKAGVWNGSFYKHPKWHKKGLGHSHSGISGIFLGMLLGCSMTLMLLCAGKPNSAHLGYY